MSLVLKGGSAEPDGVATVLGARHETVLALFSPVDPWATGEFGTIDEWFTDPDHDISTQLGGTVTDYTVYRPFTCPGVASDLQTAGE